jgi:phenylalanyl-tRNA synthetase beta chain
MKVSLNWIRSINQHYASGGDPAAGGVDKLIEKIGAQLGAVEEVIDLSKKYEGALIAKVIACEKHTGADKLSVCMVDVGKARPVQVVCGAPNVMAGQMVVWLPPGAKVPSTYDKDLFILEAREIRGVVSHGMIASAKELALGDDHSGILVLDEEHKPGTGFAEAYGLNDTIIDIENKMFTHRPDLFGQLGIARELAGIKHQAFKSPGWYKEDADLHNDGRKNVLALTVKNELPKLVPRFTAVAIKDIKVEESPVWLKVRLASVGIRPINNIVDLTNFFMLETAQPLHAYDYDKVHTGILGIREAKQGEEVTVLGGKNVKLQKGTIVITDGSRPIGLGGVMGGAGTEVDKNTRNIILEVANFDMNTTRRTAMRYGLFSDAATRFSKNQSPRQTRAVMVKAVDDIKRLAGGRVASPIIDDKRFSGSRSHVTVTSDFINARLGLKLSAGQMASLLENVEFSLVVSGEKLQVKPPFWRTDIEIAEDVVEEVGRLYGYDRLPVILPERNLAPAQPDALLSYKALLRNILAAAGANEVLTYSFVHADLLRNAGQDKLKAYKLTNAISPDSQYYRLSLSPSLLDRVHANQKLGFRQFALFELNKVHIKPFKDDHDKDLPKEFEMLALIFASSIKSTKLNGSPLYQARTYLDYLARELGITLTYRLDTGNKSQVAAPFDATRSAEVLAGKVAVGIIGEYRPQVQNSLKLPKFCAGFEVDIKQLMKAVKESASYQPLNRYPQLEQDFCLRASAKQSYAELSAFMDQQFARISGPRGYKFELSPLDIFQRPGDKAHKQTTWRIILWHPERTLTTLETNKLLDEVAANAEKELNAERV